MSDKKIGSGRRRTASATQMIPSAKHEVKVALIGPLGGGKSALTVRYLTHRYIGEYDPNIEDTYSKMESVDGQNTLVRVMDTSDQHPDLTSTRYLGWADCLLLVFSITSRSTFEAIASYLDDWRRHRSTSTQPTPSSTATLPAPSSSRPRSRRASACSLSPPQLTAGYGSLSTLSTQLSHQDHQPLQLQPRQRRAMTPVGNEEAPTPGPALIVIAAKADLESARQVSRFEAESLCRQYDVSLVETSSAEDPESVTKVFHDAIREGLAAQKKSAKNSYNPLLTALAAYDRLPRMTGSSATLPIAGVPLPGKTRSRSPSTRAFISYPSQSSPTVVSSPQPSSSSSLLYSSPAGSSLVVGANGGSGSIESTDFEPVLPSSLRNAKNSGIFKKYFGRK